MSADTGLGWPFDDDEPPSALGWPRTDTSEAPAAVSASQDESKQRVGLPDDLPMAISIREELAAVSRETSALRPDDDASVSRETSADAGVAAPAAASAAAWPRPAAARILGVANQKGGVGKTTSTVNLAAALAQHGARVLVIDLDPQGNASTAFGVEHRAGTPSIYNVLVAGRDLAEVAVEVPGFEGLFCAPATIDLAGAEIELASMVARESRLARALEASVPYDFVFVDCPPSLGLLTVNALVAAQEVLIPIQCEFYALEGLSQLLRTLELVRSHLNPALHVSTILLTMYDGRTRLAEQVANEVRTHFGELVLGPTIPRSVRISEAPGYGQTVMTYDPHSRGALAYVEAAREIAERSLTQHERSEQ
jgi:chromosome partitioning protein